MITARAAARPAGFALALASAIGLAYLYFHATDFPTEAPLARVDEALVAWLRAHPGVHLALAPDAKIEVPLDFREDGSNRTFYGTELDLREAVPRRSIHIQRKNGRGAIHADSWNPKAGAVYQLIHGTVDVPATPLVATLALGLGLAIRAGRRRAR
jgi:hypothetical protein